MLHQKNNHAERCQILVDHLPCGLLVLNKEGDITYTNPRLQQALNYAKEDLLGEQLREYLHPEDQAMLSAMLSNSQDSGSSQKVVWRIQHAHNGWRLFEVKGVNLASGVSDSGVLMLNLRDITSERGAEEVLKRRNLELALLNRASRAFSATLDLDKVLAMVLEEVRRLMGLVACSIWLVDHETDELVCRQATGPKKKLVRGWRLVKGEGLVGLVANTGQSLNVGDVLEDEQHFAGVDEETGLALRSILSVPLNVEERVIGVIQALDTQVNRFTASDVTLLEALGASAAIAIDNARLVTTLRHRTAELKTSNRELEAFAHTVAHDLKSPLTHIIGYTDILVELGDKITNKHWRDSIQVIQRSGHKMNNIIDELLLLAKLRKEEVTVYPLNMDTIVKEALQRLQPISEKKQADIQTADGWPKALGYPPWVEEVWVNYISNAIKYGGNPPRVTLGAHANDESVSFWVRDNGTGLSAEEQKRLFVPFTHLSEVDTEGYGLGLSIVRRIVNKLSGEVWVESAPGEGSVFGFTLPRDPDDQPN